MNQEGALTMTDVAMTDIREPPIEPEGDSATHGSR